MTFNFTKLFKCLTICVIAYTSIVLYSCNKNTESKNILKISENVLEKPDSIVTDYFLDTITKEGNFIKIYSKIEVYPDTLIFKDLCAEWGNNEIKNRENLAVNFDYLVGKLDFQIAWMSNELITLIEGCGQSCTYLIVFPIKKNSNTRALLESTFYGKEKQGILIKENIVAYCGCENEIYPSLIIENLEKNLKDTLLLEENWIRGVGNIFQIIDSLYVNGNMIFVSQKDNNGKTILSKEKAIVWK